MQTANVYILETNYLAARYIYMLLSERSVINLQTIQDCLLAKTAPVDASSCLIVFDQASLASDWLSYGRKLTSCFPYSRLVLVGSREFGHRFGRVFPDWIVDVVEYEEMKRLPAAVSAAALRLGQAESSAANASCNLGSRPFQHASLSKRESEICELVRLQLSNKEIANRLNIAEVTVKFHVSNAFAKMGLRRRRELFHNC